MNLTVYSTHLTLNLFLKKNLTPATSAGYTGKGGGYHNFIIPCINNKPSHREENTLNTLNHMYNNKIHISCFSETLKSQDSPHSLLE